MRRRTLWWGAAGLGLVALLAAGAVLAWPRANRITRENSDRIAGINLGRLNANGGHMSRAEVEAILGPPGDYRSGPTRPEYEQIFFYWGGITGWVDYSWECDTGTIAARFYDDRLSGIEFKPMQKVPQSALDALLWRAKRQWHRWFPEKPEAP